MYSQINEYAANKIIIKFVKSHFELSDNMIEKDLHNFVTEIFKRN